MGKKGKKGGGGNKETADAPQEVKVPGPSQPPEPPQSAHTEPVQKPKQRKKKDHGVESAEGGAQQIQGQRDGQPKLDVKPQGSVQTDDKQPSEQQAQKSKQRKKKSHGVESAEGVLQQGQGDPASMERQESTSKQASKKGKQQQDPPPGAQGDSQDVPMQKQPKPQSQPQHPKPQSQPVTPTEQQHFRQQGPFPQQQMPARPQTAGPWSRGPAPQQQQARPQTAGPWSRGPAPQQQQAPAPMAGPWSRGPAPQQQMAGQQQYSPQTMGGPQQQGPQMGGPRQQGPPHQQQSLPQQKESSGRPQGARPQSQPVQMAQGSPRSSPSKSQDIVKKMETMSLMPQRKGPGKVGRKIVVETNHFLLTIANYNINVLHYDVEIVPERPFRLHRNVFLEFQRRNYPNHPMAFDNRKNFFTVTKLKGVMSDSFKVKDDEKSEDHPGIDYTITVQLVAEFSWSKLQEYFQNGNSTNPPQIQIQALDIVLRQAAYASRQLVAVGRSFFSPPTDARIDLSNGLVLWRGFYQSAILGWKPFLNIDVAHKGFPDPINCVKSIEEICQTDPRRELERYQVQNFTNFIKGLKVVYEIPRQRNTRRTYKVNGLAESASRKKFDCDGKQITVEEYFRKNKNVALQYAHLPCLEVGNKGTCLPMELCTIMEGQTCVRKLDDKQTANMVRAAARPAYERKSRIMEKVRQVNYNSNNCVRQFGITVASEFTKVGARILDPPSLTYHQERVVTPRAGVWRADKFLLSGGTSKWAILNLDGRCRGVQDLAKQLVIGASKFGVTLPNCSAFESIMSRRGEDISFKLQKQLSKFKEESITFVVVILPNDNYGKVKLQAELSVGILTQCIRSRTVDRLNPSIIENILQKINAKLNGTNHSITKDISQYFQLMKKPVMILGADVTHPAPNQDIPSVAAVTASFDAKAFKYNVEWRIQEARDEIIRDLREIIFNHLKKFQSVNKCLPQKIVFYRDGVSEGQFRTILHEEFPAIRQACKKIQPDNYEPPVTFIVVQKRHHTRFFPNDRDADGKNKNVPAGTVVDTDITHPTEKDFYLVSHASIQGTARPTKYHVLWDDSNMSEDELQVMTYFLCHTFTRCCRSISYPAPTYYAHLAAFRIRNYCDGLSLQDLQTNRRYTEIQNRLKEIHPMFYV